MSNTDIVTAASDPLFYMRCCYSALKVAQMVASEDPATANHADRVNYAGKVLRGEDNAILLAQHVATNPAIAEALATGGPEAPPDNDIEFTLTSIWDARSLAFAPPPPMQIVQSSEELLERLRVVEEAIKAG